MMVGGVGSGRIQLTKDLFLSISNNILTLESSLSKIEINEVLAINKKVETPVGNISLTKTKRSAVTRDANMCILSATLVQDRGLLIRNWKPSDRMQPFGMKGTRLVSDLLSEAGIKTEVLKCQFPLVVLSDAPKSIVWIPGIRASELCRVDSTAETALLLSRKPN